MTRDAAVGGGDACAPRSYALTRVLGSLVIAVDDGSSLAPWTPTLNAGYLRFIEEDASQGLRVAVLRFDEQCDAASYLPPQVPIAPLPENLAALQAAAPSGTALTTSTVPVLGAALQYARDLANAAPGGAGIAVLLISDASPGVCDGLIGDYQAEAVRLAGEAYTASPAIATYAIGGDGLDTIKGIASSGGTDARLLSTLSSSDEALEFLREIRGSLQSCTLEIPDAVKLSVNSQVISTLSGGGQRAFTIYPRPDPCQADGFYLADETHLSACSGTCVAMSSAELQAATWSLSNVCELAP